MPTKGASNRYTNTHNSREGKNKRTINYAWARDFNSRTLKDHFERHGEQMGCHTQEAYAANAVKFANNIDKKNCISFVDDKGSTYKYNIKTNTLAIITKNGYVITYYKPASGYSYYQEQIKKRRKKS